MDPRFHAPISESCSEKPAIQARQLALLPSLLGSCGPRAAVVTWRLSRGGSAARGLDWRALPAKLPIWRPRICATRLLRHPALAPSQLPPRAAQNLGGRRHHQTHAVRPGGAGRNLRECGRYTSQAPIRLVCRLAVVGYQLGLSAGQAPPPK